jgi:hypothetical protein
MKSFTVLVTVVLAPSLVSAEVCTAQRRINIAQNITAAFNQPDYTNSAAGINAMPLTTDCPAIV